MRVMLDTNIFISAILFPNGRAAAALFKAILPPNKPVTCDYIIDELRQKFQEKFPHKLTELDAFLYSSLAVIEVVKTPSIPTANELLVRDKKDRPILRAAINAGIDLFLTGDKDFLESGIKNPRIISVAEFLLDQQ